MLCCSKQASHKYGYIEYPQRIIGLRNKIFVITLLSKVLLSKNVKGTDVSCGVEPANENFVSDSIQRQATRPTVKDSAVVLYGEKFYLDQVTDTDADDIKSVS